MTTGTRCSPKAFSPSALPSAGNCSEMDSRTRHCASYASDTSSGRMVASTTSVPTISFNLPIPPATDIRVSGWSSRRKETKMGTISSMLRSLPMISATSVSTAANLIRTCCEASAARVSTCGITECINAATRSASSMPSSRCGICVAASIRTSFSWSRKSRTNIVAKSDREISSPHAVCKARNFSATTCLTRQLRSFEAACSGLTRVFIVSSSESTLAKETAASTATGRTLSCSSVISRANAGRYSSFTSFAVEPSTSSPMLRAADLRTIGMSSSQSFRKSSFILTADSSETPALWRTTLKRPQADTREAHPTSTPSLWTMGTT
mmetsp:Transcript_33991/g.89204  ORF Transcript_33991/g.89204 Transcript_33991/m.89204 type:complete len:324 (-) Transcript_33991:14-985(-)